MDTDDSNYETKALVSARGISVRRSGRWLVRDVDVDVRRREIVTLIGPNGSGKTTTAKTLLGLMKPDEGSISRMKGLQVGYVPQKLFVDWSLPMTVERLMALTGRVSDQEIDLALARVGVAHLRKSDVQPLSGGEFQRVLMARAIARKPDLLVMDEPVQGVDFKGEVELYELIESIRNELNCGILMISHDLHVVMARTDTVVCLNGRVCCRGTPRAVLENPEYINLFGRKASDTLAIYKHGDEDLSGPESDARHAG